MPITAAVRSNRGGAVANQRLRADATRAALITAARASFAEAGYHATGIHDVVARLSFTRGAFYHHFADKEAMFEAVFRQVSDELNQTARSTVAAFAGDVWKQFAGSLTAYLKLVAENGEVQRIMLIDGPAVFGWNRWRGLQYEWVERGIAETLVKLIADRVIADGPVQSLAILIQAALNDAALTIASAPNPRSSSVEMIGAFMRILEGLRCR